MQSASKKRAVAKVNRPYHLSESLRPTSGRGKKAISHSNYSPVHAMVTLLYRILK